MKKNSFIIEKSLNMVCCFFIILMILSVVLTVLSSGNASLYIVSVTMVVTAIGSICFKLQWYKYKRFWITLFFVGAIAKIFVGIYIHADIISDMKHCLQAAQMTLNGDLSWEEERYFIRFGYQVPFVLYEALILKIFHTTTALYVFNAIFSIATAYLVNHIIINTLNDEYCAWVISSMYMVLPSTFLRVSTLYNQILGGFFLSLGVYFYSLRYRNKNLFFCFFNSSIFLCIGYIFRQDVAIVFIAIICVELYLAIKKEVTSEGIFRDGKHIQKTLVLVIGFILVFFAMLKSADYVMRISHLARYGIGNNAPLNTIIRGWTPENSGSYSEKYSYLVDETENMDVLKGIPYVIKHISTNENMSIFDWGGFLLRKFHYMWGGIEGTHTLLESHSAISIIALCIACMEVPFYCCALGCALYGVIKDNSYKNRELLFHSVSLIGYCLAYMIVEVQPRYRFNPMISLFLLASFGVHELEKDLIK